MALPAAILLGLIAFVMPALASEADPQYGKAVVQTDLAQLLLIEAIVLWTTFVVAIIIDIPRKRSLALTGSGTLVLWAAVQFVPG